MGIALTLFDFLIGLLSKTNSLPPCQAYFASDSRQYLVLLRKEMLEPDLRENIVDVSMQ